jgi:type II restriction/modification system DNA methylase subunit YeeA
VTAREFIDKWWPSSLGERQGSQSHFNDLCKLLGEPTPTEADPDGSWYTFEKGAEKTGGGKGWADVWKRKSFAWEYKGKHKDLTAAFAQLQRYALALENPPILIVSDMDTIVVHPNFTNAVNKPHIITLKDLEREDKRRILKFAFTDPEKLRPDVTREDITKEAAKEFAELAVALQGRGQPPAKVAHFINKIVFCLFAEDIGILPANLFTRVLETAMRKPQRCTPMLVELFTAMKDGGSFGAEDIEWFNGGLFEDADVLPLEVRELRLVLKAARRDWSVIEPSIFGTLFERGLDPSKRSQLGAHYTDQESIERIIEPVVTEPLLRDWEVVKAEVRDLVELAAKAQGRSMEKRIRGEITQKFLDFRARLRDFRVLDPACGSGNFLYLALRGLKDLEQRVLLEWEEFEKMSAFPAVGPENVLGIEINPFAAELARMTIWIGEIQWMLQHGLSHSRPVLNELDQIACRDALLNEDGTEASWPTADCIVGNPPFLGDKKILTELGDDYVAKLRRAYDGRVPGGADLVTYWFAKATDCLEAGRARRVGLVATNSIRGGQNRKALDRIRDVGTIFNAWSDRDWVLEGAAVRVSIVCFATSFSGKRWLDGREVTEIYPDLTAHETGAENGTDLTQAKRLAENAGRAIVGTQKNGMFDVPGNVARGWLTLPANPSGRPNSEVLFPWLNGMDIVRRPSDTWIIDFGAEMQEREAALYEKPFEHILAHVKPVRQELRRESYRRNWWIHAEARKSLRTAIHLTKRYIATPRVAKHRIFVWAQSIVLADCAIIAIAREDDTTFGVLHSRFHEGWSLGLCTWLGAGNDPRYTPTSTFETFPFPEGLTPNIPAEQYATDPRAKKIAEAARELNRLRENWLNPPEWTKRVPEVVPGYPDRILPIDDEAAQNLKKRTLTQIYNERPTWLDNAHKALDAAVAAAYGWPAHISTGEALTRLLALNRERAKSR